MLLLAFFIKSSARQFTIPTGLVAVFVSNFDLAFTGRP
jgi:hypothetical protein